MKELNITLTQASAKQTVKVYQGDSMHIGQRIKILCDGVALDVVPGS